MVIKGKERFVTAIFIAALMISALTCFFAGVYGDGEEGTDRFEYDISTKELKKLGLSVISIDTLDGDYVRSRLEYVEASMHIELSEEFADCKNIYTEGTRPIKIKGRGNSTWNNGYPDGKPNTLGGDTHTRKVPYNIKLEEKTELFGMGKRKSYVLLANYMDRSLLRNKLVFDLSANMGMVYTKSVYVDLILNGEYMGVYMLCEKIDEALFEGKVTDWEKIAENTAKAIAAENGFDEIWVKEMKERLLSDLSWLTSDRYTLDGFKISKYADIDNISQVTGLLVEYDGYADEASFFTTMHGVPLKIKNMEYIKTNKSIFTYVQKNFNLFEEALYSDTFYNSKGLHYSEYVDMDSLVDYYILNTVILNLEFGYKSMYMYINSEGKLVLGPCWDYDWSSGNRFLNANGDYDQWYNDGRAGNNHWYHQIYADPWFVSLVKERWLSVREGVLDMIDSIEYYYEYLSPTVKVEYDKFRSDPYERDFEWRTGGRSFAEECVQLKTFLENRVAWLDRQFSYRDPDIENRGIRISEHLELSLSLREGKLQEAGEGALADFISDAFAPLIVSAKSGRGHYSLYLNGIFVETKVTAKESVSFALSEDMFENGVNVITVYKNVDGMYAPEVNYISVLMPGEKRESVTVGRLYPEMWQLAEGGGDSEERPDAAKINIGAPLAMTLFKILLCISLIALGAAGAYMFMRIKNITKNKK